MFSFIRKLLKRQPVAVVAKRYYSNGLERTEYTYIWR